MHCKWYKSSLKYTKQNKMSNLSINFITQELSEGLFSIATFHHPDSGYSYAYVRQLSDGQWEHIYGVDTSINTTGERFSSMEDCILDFIENQTMGD